MIEGGPYRGTTETSKQRTLGLRLRARLVLGHRLSWIAWLILAIGSGAAWWWAANSPLLQSTIHGPTATTVATVVDITRHKSKSTETDREVFYQFEVAGRIFKGRSWDPDENAARGNRYPVRYQVDDPRRSVLTGMNETRYESWFPLLAAIGATVAASMFVLVAWFQARRSMKLLAYGRLAASATLASSTPAGARSSDHWAVHHYQDAEGTSHTYTTRVSKSFPTAVGTPAQVLYHPTDPRVAVVLDALPGAPRVVDGRLDPGRRSKLIAGGLVSIPLINAICAALFL